MAHPGWRSLLGGAFLLVQLALVFAGLTVDASLPRWAPNDFLVDYRIAVREAERELSPAEIDARYRIANAGAFEYPAEALLEIVKRREERLGPAPSRSVTVEYSVDGRPKVTWSFRAP
jgi:hypothetical protein